MIPELYRDGVLVAGDAAGLVINLGYTVRGMDLAVESGRQAANAVLYARRKGDFSRKTLAVYQAALENSFVMKDLKQYKNAPAFMENRRMFAKYPMAAEEIMKGLFTVDGGTSAGLIQKVLPIVKEIGLSALGGDALQAVRSL
jgi:electron transfer flavoprotein-quinone oxidoreductase